MANRNSPEQRARDAFKKRIQRLEQYGWVFPLNFVEKKRTVEQYNALRGEELKVHGYPALIAPDWETLRMPKPVAGSPARKWVDEQLKNVQEYGVYNAPVFIAQEIAKRHEKERIPWYKLTKAEREENTEKVYSFEEPVRYADIIDRQNEIDAMQSAWEREWEEAQNISTEIASKEPEKRPESWEAWDREWEAQNISAEITPEEPEKRPEVWEFDYPFGEPDFYETGLRDAILRHGAIDDRIMEGNYWDNYFLHLSPEKREWWAQFIESNMDDEQIAISKFIRFPGEESWLKEEQGTEQEEKNEGKYYEESQNKTDNQFFNEDTMDESDDYAPPFDGYDQSFDDVVWDRYQPENWDEYDQMILEMLHAEYWLDFAAHNEKARLMDNLFKKALEKFGASKVADAYVKAKEKGAEYGAKIAGHYSLADSLDYVNEILDQIEGYDNDFADILDYISENAEEFEMPD